MTEEADASSSEPEEREIATPVRCMRTLEFSGAAQQPQQPRLPPLAASGPPRGGAEPFSIQYFLSSGSGVIRQPQQPQQPFSMQPSAQQREPQQPFSMQPGPQQHEPQQREPQQPFSMPFLDSLRENVPEPDMSYNKKPQSSGLAPLPHWAPHERMFTGKGKSCKGGQGGEGGGPLPDGADSPASHSQIGAQQQPPAEGPGEETAAEDQEDFYGSSSECEPPREVLNASPDDADHVLQARRARHRRRREGGTQSSGKDMDKGKDKGLHDGQHGKGNGKHGKGNCVYFTAAHQPF